MTFVQSPNDFKHILRVLNTNIDGKQKIMYALTSIPGIGRRFSQLILRKADIDLAKRAGELNENDIEKIVTIIKNPSDFKIPLWMLNRQKDYKTGQYRQNVANELQNALREDLVRLKKIRCHRGIRHYCKLRVRGQHTKTTGRHGVTVGVEKRKGK